MVDSNKIQQVRNSLTNTSVLFTFTFLGVALLSTSIQNAIGIGFLGLPAGVVLTVALHWDTLTKGK